MPRTVLITATLFSPNDVKITSNSPKEIHRFITEKLSGVCNKESCWLKQKGEFGPIHSDIADSFAPESPPEWKKNPNEWLSSIDIMNVMKQYENAIQDYSKSIELKQYCDEPYLCIMEICIIAGRQEQFSHWLRQFEAAIPGNKLSKENLLIKLYLVCLNKCVLNEQRTDVENQLDALLKGEVKLKWSFDLINGWLDNPKNSLTPEQVKYIRGLTDKVKVMRSAHRPL